MIYRILFVALLAASAAAQHGPFTKDFVKFLMKDEFNVFALNSYKEFGVNGTFGGKAKDEEMVLSHQPVLFIHGNSDSALYYSAVTFQTGWSASVEYFKSRGFKGFELYGLTYGTRNMSQAADNSITCRNLVGIRRFIEAILLYTQAKKIDIVAHSMGVSLARKAVQGGRVQLTNETCELGQSIAHKVDALVAIAGANYGMCLCLNDAYIKTPSCSQQGFTPGTCGKTPITKESCEQQNGCEKNDYSSILQQINGDDKEAAFIASLWSLKDNVLGDNSRAWGRITSDVPDSDFKHAYENHTHFQMKDLTCQDQYNLVTRHSLHGRRAEWEY